MSFYERKIKYYKSFRLIDTDFDNIKDTLVYKPYTDNYFLQIGLEQEVKDIGYYNLGVNNEFEIIDFSSIWDENGSGTIVDGSYVPPPLDDPTGDEGETAPLSPNEFCNDPTASNYEQQLIGVAGFTPCANNSCCQYLDLGNYSGGSDDDEGETQVNCLAFYTDWGPWNTEMVLNDTEQIYVNTGNECELTVRLWNLKINQPIGGGIILPQDKGGWYGAKVKIEVDSGSGFEPVLPSSSSVVNIDNGINSSADSFTLDDKVRFWIAQDLAVGSTSTINPDRFYSTIPYRDITIKPNPNSTIRITYLQPPQNGTTSSGTAPNPYGINAKHLRLQVFRGASGASKPRDPWFQQTYPSSNYPTPLSWPNSVIQNFLGTPNTRYSDGENFVHVETNAFSSGGSLPTNQGITWWHRYAKGYSDSSPNVPWKDLGTSTDVADYYDIPVQDLGDFGEPVGSSVYPIIFPETDLNGYSKPSKELINVPFECVLGNNNVCYFDRDGDGFIETDANYPTIDPSASGSVDPGLFSKTRYDSPYIYIKPGTSDGEENINAVANGSGLRSLDSLGGQINTSSGVLTSNPSVAGWREYRYGTNSYKTVSPTCQLNGCDNIYNSVTDLTDVSNVNIFLPQPDNDVSPNLSGCANFGASPFEQVTHLWNTPSPTGYDAKGGCCSKRADSTMSISSEGPYLYNECARCHGQMTTRSAQPVLDANTKIQMQTTGSDVYYGPFYDPENPTYNGYGLAFAKANKFCREVKMKNGVKIINSGPVDGDRQNDLIIGGIIHGGAKFTVFNGPNTDFTNSYNLQRFDSSAGFDTCKTDPNSTFFPGNNETPLKCTRVTNDPNCPNNNCMRCIYCFICSSDPVEPSTFVNVNSSGTNGSTSGVEPTSGTWILLDSFGNEINGITVTSAPCVASTGSIVPTKTVEFVLEVTDTPATINLDLVDAGGVTPDCTDTAGISQDLFVNVRINDGTPGSPVNDTIYSGGLGIGDTINSTTTLLNTGTYSGVIEFLPYFKSSGWTFDLTIS